MTKQKLELSWIGKDKRPKLEPRIRGVWERTRTQAARSVNTAHVCANWLIGEQIVQAKEAARRAPATARRC